MKKYTVLFLLVILVFFAIQNIYSQTPQLTFRMNNPRILFTGGVNYLQFDVEIKSDQTNIFLDGSTIYLSFNTSGFSETGALVSFGAHYAELNINGDPKYSKIQSFTTFGGTRRYGIGITSPNASGQPGGTDYLSEVYTYFHTFVTVRLRISDQTQLSKVFFRQTEMNGVGAYKALGSSTPQSWATPHYFDAKDFAKLYLGRLFNSVSLWTQYGGTLDWTASVNTSVWDSVATLSLTGAYSAKLRIHPHSTFSPGGRFKLAHGSQLTISDSLIIEEPMGLWLQSTGSTSGGGASLIDANKNLYLSGGTALVERNLIPDQWHGYCIPFQKDSVIPYRGIYMKYWTEGNRSYHYILVPAPKDSTLTGNPFRGYMAWTSSSSGITKVKPEGSLNTGSISSIAATRTSSSETDGYNLFGNPFPSGLDLYSSSISWNQLDQKAWVWNNGNYTVYIKAGGGAHSQFIPPEQGFFVHIPISFIGSTTLGLTNDARVNTTETFLKDYIPDLLFLKAASNINDKYDITSVIFNSQATLGYDDVFDAGKLTGDNDAPQLYSIITNWNLTVNAIPWIGISQVVPLGFSCGVSGNYTITASNLQSFRQGMDIYLKDLKLNQTQSLNQDSVYSFSYQTGESASRFQLLFSNPYYGIPAQDAGSIRVYAFDQDVYVRLIDQTDIHGTLTIFDQIGRMVFTGKLENKMVNQFHPDLLQGYYVVMVQTDKSLINRKIYLK